MNRYPLWKYILVAIVVALGAMYALPNLFGELPAVQVSSAKATLKLDASLVPRVQDALNSAKVSSDRISFDGGQSPSIRVRLANNDVQKQARDVLEKALNPDPTDPSFTVALNQLPASPAWLTSLHALPMYLGLDLRGGVHFLMQVDMKTAVSKRIDSSLSDIRTMLRDKNVRHSGISRNGDVIEVKFADQPTADKARGIVLDAMTDFDVAVSADGSGFIVRASLKPTAIKTVQDAAIKQNIQTLSNRINELGVSEPVIQQQGADRVVVQLPGVQDVARAKQIIGRTATLEFRLVEDGAESLSALASGTVPFGAERFTERGGSPILLKKQVVLTGDNLSDAQAGFDGQSQQPAVHLTVDAKGARIMRDMSRENINKRMAIVLFEKGRGEVITAPVIRGELGARFQISGAMTTQEANDTSLLLRAGSLAAPMEIIEERTVGPSLGADNIQKGFNSTLYGFAAIAVFMVLYYMMMGLFSVVALSVNVMLLIALLSLLQATLTLPGIAAIALTLGMAIDANVLINERVREELRGGAKPGEALANGFERAWATILDSNITTFIAGAALFAFGSGPIKGFAVVHCLGIVTSMFSAVVVSRAMVNLFYGNRKKLAGISIGQVWTPPVSGKTAVKK
jgi:preprotein translocase subunit SecD